MKDTLGDRMKLNYEDRTRTFLPRRTYSILRLDGKSFHTYTKGLTKPFDQGLFDDMDNSIISLCKEVQGVVFAYTQSDEISLLLTDFATPQTCAWFDGNIQKMVSVSSSIMTAEFNMLRRARWMNLSDQKKVSTDKVIVEAMKLAFFDARVFTIPDPTEVYNYFVWRQQDCIRNSVSMVAQSLFSHKQLNGKSQSEMIDMIFEKEKSWAVDYPKGFRHGRLIVKETYIDPDYKHNAVLRNAILSSGDYVERTRWIVKPCWKFTEQPQELQRMIPSYE